VIVQAKHLPNWMPEQQRQSWLAVAVQIVGATLLSGGIVYLATSPSQLVRAGTEALAQSVTPQVAPAAPPPAQNPVQYRNPFDPAEVFEFPPGTTEISARQAVAEALMQRARDRQQLWATDTRAAHKPGRAARIGP